MSRAGKYKIADKGVFAIDYSHSKFIQYQNEPSRDCEAETRSGKEIYQLWKIVSQTRLTNGHYREK